MGKEYDILIAGGTVYDGLGTPGRPLDVAIRGDKIHQIAERLDRGRAETVIEADGLSVDFDPAHAGVSRREGERKHEGHDAQPKQRSEPFRSSHG